MILTSCAVSNSMISCHTEAAFFYLGRVWISSLFVNFSVQCFWSKGSPLGTPEPLVLLTPPRCLTANRTQHGVLLTWLPPANHSSPIDRYIMEFRLGERWEVLDDLIPSTETELIARDLVQVSDAHSLLKRLKWGVASKKHSIYSTSVQSILQEMLIIIIIEHF